MSLLLSTTKIINDWTDYNGHMNLAFYILVFDKSAEEILSKFNRIVVCELNAGQFANYLRMNFQGFVFEQYNKLQGFPFTSIELESHFKLLLSK